jgi:hypothetical protein
VSDLAPEIPNVTIRNFCIGVNGGVIATHALSVYLTLRQHAAQTRRARPLRQREVVLLAMRPPVG